LPVGVAAIAKIRYYGKTRVALRVPDFDTFSALYANTPAPFNDRTIQESAARFLAGSVVGVDPDTETFIARFQPLWRADATRAIELIFQDKRDLLLAEMSRASARQAEGFSDLRSETKRLLIGASLIAGAMTYASRGRR
jgi:hypothetical protein